LCFTIFTKSFSQSTVEIVGDNIQLGLPVVVLGLTALEQDWEGGKQYLKSAALALGTTFLIKGAINRTRPTGGMHSFPSGHTSFSFMNSTYIYKRYGWKLGIPATALATFVGYSRYSPETPKHFISDVIAGAIIGVGSSLLFTERKGLEISSSASSESVFVSIRYTFP